MKVDYVLYGEIDRTAQRMSTHLVRVQDGVALLDETYDEKFDDIFRLEDSLSAKVLNSLLVTLDHEEKQGVQKRYTANQHAYEAFLKAHFFMGKATRPDTDRSIELFQQAIDLDPKYAMAYAGLSDVYMRLRLFGVAPADFLPKSRAAVMKALELDDTVAYAHSMLGRIAYQYDWDFSRAEREYVRARELDPKLTHAWFGFLLLILNRPNEAEAEQLAFEQFLPFGQSTNLAQHFYFTGQYDRVVDNLNGKIAASPDNAPLHEWIGLAYEQQNRSQQATDEFQKAIRLSEGVDGLGSLGHLYAMSGKKDEAQKILQKIDEVSKRLYVSPYQKAVIYAALGKADQALAEIEKAYNQRSLLPTSARFDPRLNELRRDPRFQDFLRRTGMPM
jgi:tetratricopeptide (TPR) repeat protein